MNMPLTRRSGDPEQVRLMTMGIRFLIDSGEAAGRLSLVDHDLPPKTLGAPLHTHSREDEYTYVLEGRIGFQIGEAVFEAEPGDVVFKPRGVPHAFWNASGRPAKMLEIISPGGFENYFREMSTVLNGCTPDLARAAEICGRFGIDMQFQTVPELMARHDLGGEPAQACEAA